MTVLPLLIASCLTLGGTPTDDEILAGADARIEKHRMGDVVLRLRHHGDQPIRGRVEIRQTRHAFLFGSNIFVLNSYKDAKENEAYAKCFSELLNYATLPFYWWGYEEQQGQTGHARIEAIAAWCKEHNVITKGHPLAWNFFDPKWIPADAELAGSLQMARIFREVTQFRDRIGIWDVVNEATAYDRPECWKNSPVLTRVIREQGVGPYLRRAFRAARAANPKATLVINDYRVGEDYGSKVIDELVDEQGKPLYDVIGIQCHQHGGAWSARHAWEICEQFSKFNKPLHFTEATILSGKVGWELKGKDPKFEWVSTPEGEERQAREVVRFYTTLFSHPAVEAITWWDFADKHAWQGAPAGFLRLDMTPKPAYEALRKLVKSKWWTNLELPGVQNGELQFRGFYGDYEVFGNDGDRNMRGTFTLSKATKGPIEVPLVTVP